MAAAAGLDEDDPTPDACRMTTQQSFQHRFTVRSEPRVPGRDRVVTM